MLTDLDRLHAHERDTDDDRLDTDQAPTTPITVDLTDTEALADLRASILDRSRDGAADAAATLDRLSGAVGDIVIEPGDLRRCVEVVECHAAASRERGNVAVGLVDASPTTSRTGLLRSWSSAADGTEIAIRATAAVTVRNGLLNLEFGDDRSSISDVRSFVLGAVGGVVTDADGVEHVVGDDATAALCHLAPDATSWRVRRVPEVLVWATPLAELGEIADVVSATGRAVQVRIDVDDVFLGLVAVR